MGIWSQTDSIEDGLWRPPRSLPFAALRPINGGELAVNHAGGEMVG